MFGTSNPPPGAASDPSLLALVPASSTRRNLALAAAALVVLWGVWVSPALLRPSVGHSDAGQWSALGPHHEVLVIVSLEPHAWPWAELESVHDVSGARVEGAWLIDQAMENLDAGLVSANFASGLAYLRAGLPQRDLPSAALPQRMNDGASTQLVILWEITDCSKLRPDDRVTLELRSAVRTRRRQPIADFAAPGFDIDTLHETGSCPMG